MARAVRRRTPPPAFPGRRTNYQGFLFVFALFAALSTFFLIVILRNAALPAVLSSLRALPGHVTRLTGDDIDNLGVFIAAPLGVAVAAYSAAALSIRLLRLWLYTRGLRRFALARLAFTPLYRPGVGPTAPQEFARYNAKGQRLRGRMRSLGAALEETPRVLLLGEAGSGKTTALYTLVDTLTRRRRLLALLFGGASLPVFVSFASYGADAGEDVTPGVSRMVAFIARQMRVFGSEGLIYRLPRLLRSGRVTLLCDGLDDAPARLRAAICEELVALLGPADGAGRRRRSVQVALAYRLDTYVREPRAVAPLREFARVAMSGMRVDATQAALRATRAPRGATRPSRGEVAGELRARRLDISLGLPTALAALVLVWGSAQELPLGRGQLYSLYVEALCQRAALLYTQGRKQGQRRGDGGVAVEAVRLREVLGALASSLRRSRTHVAPVAGGQRLGEALAAWLEGHRPLLPTDVTGATRWLPSADEGETLLRAALRGGILQRTPDGLALAFADTVLEAAFAGRWLSDTDDGIGRLNPELLRAPWTLPLLLWAGSLEDAADLASRLPRLVDTPESASLRAGLTQRLAIGPVTYTLALAALLEGLTPRLTQLAAERAVDGQRSRAVFEAAEQRLRDILDPLQVTALQFGAEGVIADTLVALEEQAGTEPIMNMLYLARQGGINRLARAQLVTLLGERPAPDVLDGLVELLVETDPILRQAVNTALSSAGAAALPALRAALSNSNERIRIRAGEALTLLGDAAIGAALAGLAGADAGQRATAAQTLGALRATQAEEALIGRLDDVDMTVRLAAARALGQIGGGQTLAALERRSGAGDAAFRAAVAQALGALHDARAIVTLMKLLDDDDGAVRAAAALALGLLGDERAVPALQTHRADPDPWAQNAVVAALRTFGY